MPSPIFIASKNRAAENPEAITDAFKELERQATLQAFVQENVVPIATSGTAVQLPNVLVATLFLITLTANCTITFMQAATGKNFAVALKQDATGSRTVTWPATVKWSGGTAPTLTTTAGKIDTFSFLCYDGTNWLGYFTGNDF